MQEAEHIVRGAGGHAPPGIYACAICQTILSHVRPWDPPDTIPLRESVICLWCQPTTLRPCHGHVLNLLSLSQQCCLFHRLVLHFRFLLLCNALVKLQDENDDPDSMFSTACFSFNNHRCVHWPRCEGIIARNNTTLKVAEPVRRRPVLLIVKTSSVLLVFDFAATEHDALLAGPASERTSS